MSKNIFPYGLLGERSKPPALFCCYETPAIDLLLENFIAAARGIPAATDSRVMIQACPLLNPCIAPAEGTPLWKSVELYGMAVLHTLAFWQG